MLPDAERDRGGERKAHTHTHARTHARTQSYTVIHSHTQSYTVIHSHTHWQLYTVINTHATYAYIYTHMHIHTLIHTKQSHEQQHVEYTNPPPHHNGPRAPTHPVRPSRDLGTFIVGGRRGEALDCPDEHIDERGVETVVPIVRRRAMGA